MPVRPPQAGKMAASPRATDSVWTRPGPGLRAAGRGVARRVDARRGALAAQRRRRRPQRQWTARRGAEPVGRLVRTTDITEGAPDGPLAGRTVAVKDNTMVAGVPMMNGSRTVEGFVPTRDATVVTPAARGRRDGHGQVGLRGPLLLRRAATPRTPARCATPGTRAGSTGGSLQRQRGAGRRRRGRPGDRGRPGRLGPDAGAPTAGSSGTSRRTGWCPTPAPSRSRRRSTTWAR